ncbi:MAG: 23S rRNA (guanosine(2251)-2'-O)-methyltransferase RlmB [Gammaproteobacteria bacterium]|jgi:23S rRNA (guanosine2251-2'-O)-methyltransferase|nr:23S rRNA (guanosine(2251)-2'-O)-methyltransferase RlmB [Gammaproteobacteria bacterium]|tara:strand:- start:289 stop:1032 length:744 start_codon:yes stop_codon:yes gene_type:complete
MSKESFIYGINSVAEALEYESERIVKIFFVENQKNNRVKSIIRQSNKKNILSEEVTKEFLQNLLSTSKNQGIAATLIQKDYFDAKTALHYLKNIESPLVLILDDLDDPRNIGACYRTANAVGVDMVVVSKNRISLNSPVISKVSSGAFELTNTAIVSNIAQFIGKLKKNGFWIYGSSDTANKDYTEIDYESSTVIVIGSEGKGMRDLTAKKCDHTIRIPMKGQVESLNVSVACGVVLYEVLRQRDSF